jgi:hypothetical protein
MGKMRFNKDAVVGLLFWLVYSEVLVTIASLWLGLNWWYLQPVAVVIAGFMFALTAGSQTKDN